VEGVPVVSWNIQETWYSAPSHQEYPGPSTPGGNWLMYCNYLFISEEHIRNAKRCIVHEHARRKHCEYKVFFYRTFARSAYLYIEYRYLLHTQYVRINKITVYRASISQSLFPFSIFENSDCIKIKYYEHEFILVNSYHT